MVSLHAIKGSQGPHTMRFEASLKSIKAIVLVDSGSTHNFMDLKLANKLALPICPQEKFKVTVTDGKSIMIQVSCQNVQKKIQGFEL